ncbi:MAG TPA: LysE family translocator [Sphingomicrobium sp.]
MDWQLWTAFALASLVVAIVPGPGVASIVGFAFSSGRTTALASVLGMAVGNVTAMTISLAGAGAVLASSALAFTVLKWIGAAYLIVIGLWALWKSGSALESATPAEAISPKVAFVSNVAVGTFHPKTIIFFVAFATQFISPNGGYWAQAAILIATFTVIAAATDTTYALAASRTSTLLRGNGRKWFERAGGCALIGAGVATAAIRR